MREIIDFLITRKINKLFVYYFGGAQSKGFATLRNVPELTFLGQDWARKVFRFRFCSAI